MAALNLLIGVGGTGAKVVESSLYGFLAGMGPPAVQVGFVDQDEANGNVKRARELLGRISAFQSRWTPDSENGLDWSSAQGAAEFASVAVRPIEAEAELWCPHSEQGTTLAGIFGASVLEQDAPDLKGLMDLLYQPDETEQFMDLGVGYRGRPHIGAAAILSGEQAEGAPFWRAIRQALGRAQQGQEVRIFLAGSVFGGTGAAGFPTLARIMRALTSSDAAATGNVRIGGALMLPYFAFAAPDDSQANVARSEHLLRQSRAALKYYHELFRHEAVFDEFYLLGWSPNFQLGYHSPGSSSQANPALPPELLAAMAAVRFFDPDHVTPERNNATFVSARTTADAVTWTDLPTIGPGRESEPYNRLGQLLRFCTAWRNTIRPALKPRMFGGDPWFKRQGAKDVNYNRHETEEALNALDQLVERTLVWAASMQFFATTGAFGPPSVRDFGLWDLSPVARFAPEAPTDPVRLSPPLLTGGAEAYRRILVGTGEPPPDQAFLFDEINRVSRPGNHRGLGRIVAAVHHAARTRAAAVEGAAA